MGDALAADALAGVSLAGSGAIERCTANSVPWEGASQLPILSGRRENVKIATYIDRRKSDSKSSLVGESFAAEDKTLSSGEGGAIEVRCDAGLEVFNPHVQVTVGQDERWSNHGRRSVITEDSDGHHVGLGNWSRHGARLLTEDLDKTGKEGESRWQVDGGKERGKGDEERKKRVGE